MLHKISLNYFPNGYSVATGGSCLDLPVAVALGNIFEPSYLYYLATKSAEINWRSSSEESWPDETKRILSDLGFNFHALKTDTWLLFLQAVKKAVDNNNPLIVPVSYHKLFYYLALNDPCPHVLMVTGYDEENQLLLIVDCNVVEHGLVLPNKDYTLYRLPLTFDIFRDIWEESQLLFIRFHNPLAYNVYTVLDRKCIQKNASNVFVSVLSSISEDNSLLRRYVDQINAFKSADEFIGLRRSTLLQLRAFFDLVEKTISDELNFKEWEIIRNNFIANREKLINRLEVNYRKGKLLRQEERDEVLSKIADQEKRLFDFMLKIAPRCVETVT